MNFKGQARFHEIPVICISRNALIKVISFGLPHFLMIADKAINSIRHLESLVFGIAVHPFGAIDNFLVDSNDVID